MSACGRLGQSLARCPHLTALHASHNALPDAAGGALLDGLAERSGGLAELELGHNQLHAAAAAAAAPLIQMGLASLSLCDNRLRAEDLTPLAAALEHNGSLRHLDLSGNLLGQPDERTNARARAAAAAANAAANAAEANAAADADAADAAASAAEANAAADAAADSTPTKGGRAPRSRSPVGASSAGPPTKGGAATAEPTAAAEAAAPSGLMALALGLRSCRGLRSLSLARNGIGAMRPAPAGVVFSVEATADQPSEKEAEVVAAAAAVAGGASKPGRVAAEGSPEQILHTAGRAALDALGTLPGHSWRDLAAMPEVSVDPVPKLTACRPTCGTYSRHYLLPEARPYVGVADV